MNVTSRVRLGAVVGAAALGVGLLAPVAVADPESGEYRALVTVGSDTTQDVLNSFGENVPDNDGVPDDQLIASYDATGSATVKTRPVGCQINRPNGSSAGIDALRNAVDTGSGCIDFARSSRGPANTSTQDLTFVPFAKDAVTFAVRGDAGLSPELTTQQLRDIYACTLTSLNGVALTPLLPQANSGTRTFFLGKINLPEAQVGSCVGSMQEHNGVQLDTAGDIAPYSVAQWIAQSGGVVNDRHGDTVLGTIDGAQPLTSSGTLNVAFPYNRDVYNVIPTSKLSDPVIAETFVGTDSTFCSDDYEAGVTEVYGFGALAGDLCGATNVTGER